MARERASSVLTRLAHVMLGVEREAKLVYEIKLGFEEVDMLLLLMQQLLEQIAANVILHGMAMRCRFLVQSARCSFEPEIALEDIRYGLPDMERIELHARHPSRKMMRTTRSSACSISSINSLRQYRPRVL